MLAQATSMQGFDKAKCKRS